MQTIPVRSVPIAPLLLALYGDEGLTRSGARALAQYVYEQGGMFVLGVDPGAPASRRGLEFGDVDLRMNGLKSTTRRRTAAWSARHGSWRSRATGSPAAGATSRAGSA